jgi:hypothetical protein
MRHDLRPGSRVARIDIPGIVGVVVSVRNGQAQVRWSEHFEQWAETKLLMLVRDVNQKARHSHD